MHLARDCTAALFRAHSDALRLGTTSGVSYRNRLALKQGRSAAILATRVKRTRAVAARAAQAATWMKDPVSVVPSLRQETSETGWLRSTLLQVDARTASAAGTRAAARKSTHARRREICEAGDANSYAIVNGPIGANRKGPSFETHSRTNMCDRSELRSHGREAVQPR
jgi:hypothetical protein